MVKLLCMVAGPQFIFPPLFILLRMAENWRNEIVVCGAIVNAYFITKCEGFQNDLCLERKEYKRIAHSNRISSQVFILR